MSSKNAPFIKAYATAIANELTSGQLSDLVGKIADDLDKVYTTVFSGPIPADSIPSVNRIALPDKIAWLDLVNTFEKQNIGLGNWDLKGNYLGNRVYFSTAATKPSRLQVMGDGITLVGSGINFDGGVFNSDGGNNSGLVLNNGYIFSVVAYIAGVLNDVFRIETAGQVSIGVLTNLANTFKNDLCLKNGSYVRGTNAAGTTNFAMVGFDGGNIVRLGANFNNSGDGHVGIPFDTNANMPGAGATRDGLIVLDKTNNRICYWVSGNRYFMPIGTAF